MSSTPAVLVHRDADLLAEAVAGRLITRLVDVQATGALAGLVLTGGTIADRVHRCIAASPNRDSVDWSQLQVWWGDERYVSADSPDRNELQAREALLDHVAVDPGLVHPMPTPEQTDDDIDAAAEAYAASLAAAVSPGDHGNVPTFDILMLGVGPEGHVASLFPGSPALYDERTVVGVRNSPKPPPRRITMTMPTLQHAREVWFIASGSGKAQAARLALGEAGPVQVPAAGPRGIQATWWFLDRAAAAELPAGLARPASP